MRSIRRCCTTSSPRSTGSDFQSLRVWCWADAARRSAAAPTSDELSSLDETTAGAFVGRIHSVCNAIRAPSRPGGRAAARRGDRRRARDRGRLRPAHRRRGHPVLDARSAPGHPVGSRGGAAAAAHRPGRAAWLVLTGEPINARRACEWGLIEAIGGDAEVAVAARQAARGRARSAAHAKGAAAALGGCAARRLDREEHRVLRARLRERRIKRAERAAAPLAFGASCAMTDSVI